MTKYSIYKKLVIQDIRSKKLDFTPDGRKHYVYRVTDYTRNEKQHYYGSHTPHKYYKGNNLIEEFWSYKTSSKYNTLNEDKKENYKVKIIKVFNNAADKMIYEAFLHQYFNVKLNNNFWNESNQTPFGYDTTGKIPWNKNKKTGPNIFSDTHKKNISKSKIGHIVSEETREKIRSKKTGVKLTDEHKKKVSKALTDHIVSEETREKISVAHKGVKLSEHHRKKISEGSKGKKLSEEHKNKIASSNRGKKMTRESQIKKGNRIIIYDNKNNIIADIKGYFKEKCEELGIPYKALAETYRNNTLLYNSKKGRTNAINKGRGKFIGWYARKIS